MNTRQRPLTVYKASAGSGKTFTLAIEYIKLLVVNPYNYKKILAVTFTNKATEEMKMRILSQLYGIWKGLPDSKVYLDEVCKQLDTSPALVSKNAGIALELLLHNYSYFRVETIDSFFQSILRNLAHELDLTANLRIDLDSKQVEDRAVDIMIDELDAYSDILQWIMKYINEKISDNKSWNIIWAVKKLGLDIFKDFYKNKADELERVFSEKGFFDQYIKDVRHEADDAKQRMAEIGEAFLDAIDAEGLSIDDFSYKATGVAGLFVKLKNGNFENKVIGERVSKALLDSGSWIAKKHPRHDFLIAFIESQLMQILQYAVDEQPKQFKRVETANATLAHINQLRLLGAIEKKVREINENANRFLLNDTQQLLHSMISDSDSPFIFEKIGSQLEHVMIDEFQDTGTTQWKNFKVLLEECMSHTESTNLIVGDVKQSIYRWRAGDWRLLNNIEDEIVGGDEQMEVRSLDTNYRSTRNVVQFNNAFFTAAKQAEYDILKEDNEEEAKQLLTAYADVCQHVDEKKPADGMVSVKLLPKEGYDEAMLSEIEHAITTLYARGVAYDKMAILVRKNDYITEIAEYFMRNNPDITIVSDEAFRLDASLAVNVIVQALHFLAHPEDDIAKVFLAKAYQQKILADEGCADDMLTSGDNLDKYLPQEYVAERKTLAATPLYDLAERIYAMFKLNRLPNQSAYVCAFYDKLSQFIEEQTTDIDAFTEEWESNLCRKTIKSDEANGIRILSIHKSKGLEYDNVIIPYCDWTIERKQDIFWVTPKVSPYDRLPIVPLTCNSKLNDTFYADDYHSERLQVHVDNLNLLYVAFTRASRNLFIIGTRETNNNRSTVIADCLPTIANQLDGALLTGDIDNKEEPLVFTYGNLSLPTDKRKTAAGNVFLGNETAVRIGIDTYANKVNFRQSNKSRNFIEGEDDEKSNYIKMGCVLHNVFSTIKTADDIDGALATLHDEGLLYDDVNTAERVQRMLRKRLEDPRVKAWFSDKWQLFNECTLLFVDPDTGATVERRPDRVMYDGKEMIVVDFKFATPKDEHRLQVEEYMRILETMGYADVKGFLWYVYTNSIIEVRSKEVVGVKK